MSEQASPNRVQRHSAKQILISTAIAVGAAAIALLAFILPAEFGIDPTGIGRATGLTAIRGPVRTLEITDVLGGNESYREVEIPDFGDPVPLPNPAIFQDQPEPPLTRTLQITIPPESETEIKTVLNVAKSIQFSWSVDRGDIYTDFHGHDPEAGDEYWVRYKEQQEAAGNNGSLVAPFTGEHGWYWLNYNDFPVVVTLTVSGYFNDIIDYGIF